MMTTRALHWITLLACVGSAGCTHDPSAADDAEPGGAPLDAMVDQRPRDGLPQDRALPDRALRDIGLTDMQADVRSDASVVDPDMGQPPDMRPRQDWSFPDTLLPPLTSTCPNQRGMIGVPFPDGACYLMDPWPVTRGGYHAALEAGPLRSSHPACEGHQSAGPRSERIDSGGEPFCYINVHGCMVGDDECVEHDRRMPWPPDGDESTEPMVCVAWCDAQAYCERAGKRLCGARAGAERDDYDVGEVTDIDTDELYNACMGGGLPRFPLGLRSEWFGQTDQPLRRANLVEGAWEGLFGLASSFEWRGPIPSTFMGDVQNPDVPCGALNAAVWREQQRRRPDGYGGFITFRCCADAE